MQPGALIEEHLVEHLVEPLEDLEETTTDNTMHKATSNAMQEYTCTTLTTQTAKWVLTEGSQCLALYVQPHITMNQHKQNATDKMQTLL